MPLKSLFGCTITLCTKLRLYNAFVSVLLHGAETWTLLSAEIRRTETRGIQHVMPATYTRNSLVRLRHNATIINRTGQESVRDKITRQRRAMFGQVRRLPEVTAAHMALHMAVKAMVTAPTTGRNGNVHVAGLAIRGCNNWKSTQDSPLMPHGHSQ